MNQFNYFNYAQHIEQLRYKSINESVLITEADSNPIKALNRVKSGANGGGYAPQWKQLIDSIGVAVDAGQKTGKVMVKHDAAIGGKDMVEVTWSIDASNNVSLSTSSDSKTQDSTALEVSSKLVELFTKEVNLWKPNAGITDNEEGFLDSFKEWRKGSINQNIAQLADSDPNKKSLTDACASIEVKILGDEASDIVSWLIKKADGSYVKFMVDTDIGLTADKSANRNVGDYESAKNGMPVANQQVKPEAEASAPTD